MVGFRDSCSFSLGKLEELLQGAAAEAAAAEQLRLVNKELQVCVCDTLCCCKGMGCFEDLDLLQILHYLTCYPLYLRVRSCASSPQQHMLLLLVLLLGAENALFYFLLYLSMPVLSVCVCVHHRRTCCVPRPSQLSCQATCYACSGPTTTCTRSSTHTGVHVHVCVCVGGY